jgi:hypothetical protein
MDGLTLEGESYGQMLLDRKVKDEHLISKRTHKLIALRFLVRV